MERFRRMAPFVGVLVAALMVALLVPGRLWIVVVLGAIIAVGALIVRGREDEDERHRR